MDAGDRQALREMHAQIVALTGQNKEQSSEIAQLQGALSAMQVNPPKGGKSLEEKMLGGCKPMALTNKIAGDH